MLMVPERPPDNAPKTFRLSKSKYLSGLQCQKRIYLEIHEPELAAERDEAMQALLDRGTELGELARQRFLGGVLVEADYRHRTEALQRTQDLLRDPTVPAIFEGAFEFDQVLVRVDILERAGVTDDGTATWRLIEVKSSTKVKAVHLNDLSVQAYVLTGAGIVLSGAYILHINTQYIYKGGEYDLLQLFALQDLTAVAIARRADVQARLPEMRTTLALPSPPEIEPDGHCHTPYECPFWDHCTKDKPVRWIYYLPGGDRAIQQLVRRGIQTIDEIPAGVKLSPAQHRVKNNVEWIGPGLEAVLQTARYPVHHLDFETFMVGLPKFPMTRPYEPIPMQWSNHIQTMDGEVDHHEYLCMDLKDPREELALALLQSVGQEGSICVYSPYERSILERLGHALPSLKRELQGLITRLWDLFSVIRDHYYHPDFQGSFSIKSVLPAVVPSLGYQDLDIQEGEMAVHHYYQMVFMETDWVEKLRIREALLRYCERDTLGMLELRKALREKTARRY